MRTLIIILQILGVLTFIPWFLTAGLSFMVFDSPKTFKKLKPWFFVCAIYSYPFIVCASYWWSWSTFLSYNFKSALIWACFPLIVFLVAYFIITKKTDFLKRNKR